MSFISIALAVGVIMVIRPLFRNAHMQTAMENIETSFAELNGNRFDYTEDDWTMRLASFSAAVHNFARDYPREGDLIEKFRRYELILNGINPDNPGQPIGLTPQEQFDQLLIANAKEHIIDVTDLSVSSSGLNIRVRNPSNRIIAQVSIWIEGFDADGISLGESAVRLPPLLAHTEASEFFTLTDMWGRTDVVRAKVTGLNVDYGQDENWYFRAVVCEALWP
jgi:hypothetical protein